MPAKPQIAERLATLEHHVNENFFEIQRRLDELLKFEDRAKMNFLDVERKLVEFDQKLEAKGPPEATKALESVKSYFEEKIKSLEDVLMLLELEVVKAKERIAPAVAVPELAVTPAVPSALEDRLRTLEEKFSMLEKLKLNVPVELIQHEPRLKAIEANVLAVQKSLREEASRLEGMIAGRVVTEPAAERFIVKMREEMDELRRDIEKAELLKHEILAKERAFATRPDLEAFEARIRAEVSRIHDITDRIAAAEKSLDTRLVDIEDKLVASMADFQSKFRKEVEAHVKSYSDVETALRTELDSHRRTFDSKIADLEAALRTEFETRRRAFDSRIVDIEESMAKVAAETAASEARKDVETAIAAHRSEIAQIMQRVNTIERDLESRATALVSKELAAFSEAIDRKFPDLVTKADFAAWSRAVAERIQAIEAPDVSPLVDRIDRLELRLNELAGLIREVAMRMPLVIE